MFLRGTKLLLQAAACMVVMAGSANALTIIDAEINPTSGVTDAYGQVPTTIRRQLCTTPGSSIDYFNFSLASAPLGTVTRLGAS